MNPHAPTPEWAIASVDRITASGDPDQLDALLMLLAGIAPTEEQDRYKCDAAWAAIEYGYTKTQDCANACRRYLGVAV